MPDDPSILRYLPAPRGSFWAWGDDGQRLAWAGGETIAFRAELLAVVRRLADGGRPLPPFGAVVLLLAATRDGWPAAGPRLVGHAERLVESGGGDTASAVGVTLRAVGHRLASDAAAVVAGLDAVAALPVELRRSPAAKAVLAEVVFERAATAGPAGAAVMAELESGVDPATVEPVPGAVRELVDVIEALRPGLAAVDAERLAVRLRTGLDGPVRPADADVGPTERARQLLAQPSDDPDLSAVTRIARGLLAAVAVPRPVGSPDDRPAGGVADLSNRGPLDRLLLSELAHDDLTLAVRVAVNEALYLQRETPPREPPRRRAILVDTGLRTWGVPRVFATAVALALTATADADGTVAAHRPAAGPGIVPADLTTAAGLLDHLAALDGRAHFGDALPAFVAAAGDAEPFLVTHEDVLDDVDFQRAVRAHGPAAAYAAGVDRDGSFRLWHLSAGGRRLVRSARLDLDALLAPPRRRSSTPVPLVAGEDLPTILSTTPFPLRVPPTSPVRAAVGDGSGGSFAITRDRRLLAGTDPAKAAGQVSDRVPAGRVAHLGYDGDRAAVSAVVLRSRRSPGGPCAVLWSDADGVRTAPVDLPFDPVDVVVRAGTAFVIGRRAAAAVDPCSGEVLATLDTSAMTRFRGRIYIDGGVGRLLAYDGRRLVAEPLPVGTAQVHRVFEWVGADGPLVIGPTGEVTAVGGGMTLERAGVGRPVVVTGVSADGRRLSARAFGPVADFCLELGPGAAWTPLKGRADAWVGQVPPPRTTGFACSLRTRLTGVAVDPSGTLVVVGRRGLLRFRMYAGQLCLWAVSADKVPLTADRVRPFVRTAPPADVGYSLRLATWPDGTRAVLDSRGLLHLRSVDRTVPEVTLVLATDGPVGGWSSDGRVYGPPCFHDGATSYDPTMLEALVRRFTERLR